jgi:hypothetical protein
MNFSKTIQMFVASIGKTPKTPLGRWNLDSPRHAMLKTHYANEDHCGTCSEYINQQKEQKEIEEFYQIVIYSESVPDKHITDNKPS